ncbi:MAG: methyltransferase domain-containing protein [Sporichthyaceae bacterium]
MTGDPWAEWLLHRRDGGDPATREAAVAALVPIRDRVLADAEIAPGDRVLDVGCGDGLLGRRAAELVGPTGHVCFGDVSTTLLDVCRGATTVTGHLDRCAFLRTALPDLAGVERGGYDAVVVRSVLIYLEDKAASLAALLRVLRPGGRLAIFEPINAFGASADPTRLWGFGVCGVEDLAERVGEVARAGAAEHATMLGFDERDLFAWTLEAGFVDVRMEYRAEVAKAPPPGGGLDAFLATAPNPLAPTYAELLAAALSGPQQARLRARLARAFAEGDFERRAAAVHLRARRPAQAKSD